MRHFDEALEELKTRLLQMGGLVESAIYRSVAAVVEKDADKAQQVLKDEARINHIDMEIDELATRLLVLQQPMAMDLRLITAAIKINNDLERMGDLAVNIAERALSLLDDPTLETVVDIPRVAKLAQAMVHNSLDAFVKEDTDLARSVLLADDEVDRLRDALYEDLIAHMQKSPQFVRQGISLMFVVRNLERVADHATNLAEDVLFLVQGVDVRHHTAEGD